MMIEPIDLNDADHWKSACCIAACFGVLYGNQKPKPMTTEEMIEIVTEQFGSDSIQYRREQAEALVRIYEASKDGATTKKPTTKKRKYKK